MWAVVNAAGGTAAKARLPGKYGTLAGKTGSVQVRRVTRQQRESGFNAERVRREWRPNALFVAYAPYDNPQYAVSVVVEHGVSGARTAAPLAREVLIETFEHLRGTAPPEAQRIAEAERR